MEDNNNTGALDIIARELVRIRHGLEAAASVPIPDDEVKRDPWRGLICKICGATIVEKVQGIDRYTRSYIYVHSTGRTEPYYR